MHQVPPNIQPGPLGPAGTDHRQSSAPDQEVYSRFLESAFTRSDRASADSLARLGGILLRVLFVVAAFALWCVEVPDSIPWAFGLVVVLVVLGWSAGRLPLVARGAGRQSLNRDS